MDLWPTKRKIIISLSLLVASFILYFGFQCITVFCQGCSHCYFFFIKIMATNHNYELYRIIGLRIQLILVIIFFISFLYLIFSLVYFIYFKVKKK